MKCSFFLAAVMSILLYGCTIWMLTKLLEKKLDGNYTRMLRAILNKSWRQHRTKQQLYGHLPPITKTIKVRWTRHAGHCWRSRDELIKDVLLWTPSHGRAKQSDQLKPTYSSSVRILGVALRTCRKRWTIRRGGKRGSGMSMLLAWQDDDDNDTWRKLEDTETKILWMTRMNPVVKVMWIITLKFRRIQISLICNHWIKHW